MIDFEEKLITRWPASKILMAGAIVAAIGYLPLQLYIIFGPHDGNPIGLGFLAIAAIPAGLAVFAIGLIKLVVGFFLNRRN